MEESMGKLHELLAVEPDLKGAAEKILAETVNTFSKKSGHFQAQVRRYQPFEEGGESFPDENQEMVTTVPKKLEWTQKVVAKYLDAVAAKETSNTTASAVLEIDGKPLIDTPLPATLLLALEGRLKQIREVYYAIPTLDPGEQWTYDGKTRTYESAPTKSFRTKKVMKNHVKAEATEKHPAQVEVYTEDVQVGAWTTKKWSGALTPSEKADLLERIDDLIQAVKRARQRANDCMAAQSNIADVLFKFIHEPLKR
jgi:hypothetical protein